MIGVPSKRRPHILLLLPLLLCILALSLFYVSLQRGDPDHLPSALIGRLAPEFRLAPLEGLMDESGQPVPGFSTADLRQGRVTLVNIWSSWCGPCRLEHPILQRLAEDGLVIYGLNYKDNADQALRFLKRGGNPFTAVGVDRNGQTAVDLGVYGVPETFVLRGDGFIVYRHVGPLTPDTLDRLHAEITAAGASRE